MSHLKSLVQKLNNVCQTSLEAAAAFCVASKHESIEIEHWLVKLLEISNSDLSLILDFYQINRSDFVKELSARLSRLRISSVQAPTFSPRLIELLREALLLSTLEYEWQQIRSSALFCVFLDLENLNPLGGHNRRGGIHNLDPAVVRLEIENITTHSIENQGQATASVNPSAQNAALQQFTINLTALARAGQIDPVIGREEEIRQVIDILTRRRQNNPVLTGEPGVGKTAVVEGFALKIAQQQVPPALQNVAVHTLDLGLLQAGAGIKGEFENRLKSVINEVKNSAHPIILFIDEAHTLVGAGGQAGQADAANLLKPVLARGELRTIAATTWAEYKKYFEQDAALARRFQVVKVEEPDEITAVKMLRGLAGNLEKHHQVRVLDEALNAAVRLSSRYLTHRQLPDKAISVLDTACARLSISESKPPALIEDYRCNLFELDSEIALLKREQLTGVNHSKRLALLTKESEALQKKLVILESRWHKERELIQQIRAYRLLLETEPQTDNGQNLQKKLSKAQEQLAQTQAEDPLLQDCVDAQSIAEVVSAWTGIPLGRMISKEVSTILNLEKNLQARIVGQRHALQAITENIQTARAQLADPCKPIGTFLFVGPSGVGKTETAFALAELMYGSERNMTVINLSEFKEEHKVSLLLGSPPGYVGYGEGGILTEAVRRSPYSLILLDELEKAHPGVQDIFYQVFDKGTLRDGQGRDINFKNTIIILTSNVGSELITKLCLDPDTLPNLDGLSAAIRPELLKVFKPAFLARVSLIPYLPLSDDLMKKITELQLQKIQNRVLSNYQVKMTYDPKILEYIAGRCREVESGARTIDHLLTRQLLPELSAHFLSQMEHGKVISGVHIGGINADGKFKIEFKSQLLKKLLLPA